MAHDATDWDARRPSRVALSAPATAAIIAASLVSPALLPLALIGVVSAHAVHLLGDQLATAQPLAAATAEPPSPALGT